MTIVDYEAYCARKEREGLARSMARTHRCGICGGALSNPFMPALGEIGLVCSQDRQHRGYERIRGAMERYRAGEALPGDVAQAIERVIVKRRLK